MEKNYLDLETKRKIFNDFDLFNCNDFEDYCDFMRDDCGCVGANSDFVEIYLSHNWYIDTEYNCIVDDTNECVICEYRGVKNE